jgi:hypothetical protein
LFCRFFGLLLLVIAAVAAARADAAPPASLDLRGDAVDYYSNRFIATADGNVSVRFSDGTVATGETFAMDLKLNRFVIAGNVHVDGRTIHERGAAYAGFLDLDRLYLLTEGGEPDRYTYFGEDYSDPHKGRDIPGDVFNLPDLSAERPFAVGRHMTIIPKTLIDLHHPRIYVYGIWTPLPSYVVNFSSNPNWYANAFSGAVADVGLPFYANKDSMSALHLRYDQIRGLYTSFDQHFVWNRDYVVFSINPLTQDQRQWNLVAYKRESNSFETRLFYQASLLSQFPLSEPKSASGFGNLAINTVLGRHAIGFQMDQWNNSLLPSSQNGITAYGLRVDGHPMDLQVSVQSYEDEWRMWRYLGLPLKFQYRFGGGYTYDSYGVATLGPLDLNSEYTWLGFVYPRIWQHFLGATVYTPSINLGHQFNVSLKSDKQRQWYSLPHYVDTTTTSATLAHTPISVHQPSEYLTYSVQNQGDYYGANQRIAYPTFADPYLNPYNNVFYTGLSAFQGFATSRTYTAGVVWSPTQNFTLNVTLQRDYDTPAPVPFLGGRPPWQISGDVRIRLSKTILMDVARSYTFNWGNQTWVPQYTLQFSP